MRDAGRPPGSAVRLERRDRVAYVTMDRPAVLNAMNRQMHEELGRVWDDVEADDGVWVAVLTGAGDRAFSVGQDLKELAEGIRAGPAGGSGRVERSFGSCGEPGWPRLTERFAFPKPVIARVNGYALGGGFEMALACDVIVASDNAVFGLPEARLGLVAGAGGVFRLVRQMPYRTALGHLMTGRRISATRALELGLVNEVVPPADLDACVDGWVGDILRCAPLAVRAVKEAAAKSAAMALEQAFATRFHWEEKRARSRDAEEGPLAFVDRRTPVWRCE
jgi:dehydration protein DpgD